MSSCPTAPPVDNSRQLRALEARVRYLENQISGIKEITGVCMSAADLIVPLYSALYDPATGKYTITFASTPGTVYQIQKSSDGVTWVVADPASVVGASCDCAPEPTPWTGDNGDPLYSTWVSNESFALDVLPIYFRVREFPRAMLCAPSKPC